MFNLFYDGGWFPVLTDFYHACERVPDLPFKMNSPGVLPPVDCPLLIFKDDRLMKAKRTSFIEKKNRDMEYELDDGSLIVGRYPWTYP